MIVNPMVDIAIISFGLAAISKVIQAKFIDREVMKKQQEEMKERQKKMQELMQKSDQKSKNELEALEKEMMEAMNKMLSGTTKVMMASMVVFIPAFALLGMFYGEALINLPVPLPWFVNGFDLFNLGTWGFQIYSETNWFGWYFVSYLTITILLGIGTKIYKKVKENGVING